MPKTFLILILVLAAVLRLSFLGQFPAGFSADEANFGYTAYSLLKTGHDEWGEPLPVFPRTFGDFKSPIYIYLTVPAIAIFGLTEFAVRLPAALLGILSVVIVYFLVGVLFKDNKSQLSTVNCQLLASFLLAISPWHWPLSRVGIETSLISFFTSLVLYSFIKAQANARWLVAALAVASLGVYSTNSAKLFLPLISAFMLAFGWKHYWANKKILLTGLVVSAAILLPAIIHSSAFSRRAADVSIFNPTAGWEEVSKRQFESNLPRALERIFTNKLTYTLGEVFKNYVGYYSPQFLFTNGPSEPTYGMIPGRGVLYIFELPLVVLGWVFLFVGKHKYRYLLLFWLLSAALPAALSKTAEHASRAATFLPLWSVISAYGFYEIWQRWQRLRSSRLLQAALTLVLVFSVASFANDYFFHAPKRLARFMHYGAKETVAYLKSQEAAYRLIIMGQPFSEAQVFTAFYQPIEPREYQKYAPQLLKYEQGGRTFLDQLPVYTIGKYEYRGLNWNDDKTLKGMLLVGKAADFPEKVNAQKIIYDPAGEPLYKIVDPEKL
ncbi:glycosyltransferase family 39 protein [Candidatus Daviesbacteria bacterium]|nr:glycosyltransferase family 39 protein [Candidatus Daviesbacteria bacterium]